MLFNRDKIILDLCGGTGAWSKPYADAGYDVRVVTFPPDDVRLFQKPKEQIYGILIASPCTHFTVSGAQYWQAKDEDGRTLDGISITDACLRIVLVCNPVFWVLENPVGRLKGWIGDPVYKFDPCDFGDAYTKKTLLWGKFNHPVKNPVEPIKVPTRDYSCLDVYRGIEKMYHSEEKARIRSITPAGFAKAFFLANQ